MTDKTKDLTAIWEEAIRKRQAAQMESSPPVVVPLPSGLEVKAVRVNILTLLEIGRIPDAITPFVIDLMDLGDAGDADAIEDEIQKRWEEWVMMLDAVWVAAVVEPLFTKDKAPKTGVINVQFVATPDKIALFNWCQGVTDHLADFRQATFGDARSVADESGVSEVHTSGDSTGDDGAPGEQLVGVSAKPGGDVLGPVRRQSTRGKSRKEVRTTKERETDEARA